MSVMVFTHWTKTRCFTILPLYVPITLKDFQHSLR